MIAPEVVEEFLASSVDDEILTYLDISSTTTNKYATISNLLEEQPPTISNEPSNSFNMLMDEEVSSTLDLGLTQGVRVLYSV